MAHQRARGAGGEPGGRGGIRLLRRGARHREALTSPAALGRASLLAGVARLSRRDLGLAGIVGRFGPPPLWSRPCGYPTLLRIILEQQVSLASARAMYLRLAAATGAVTPAAVLALGAPGLRGLGFTRQKAAYAVELASRIEDGSLPIGRLHRLPDDDACALLTRVPGIGPWTSGIYLLMALRRPDIWPRGDLALHKTMARLEALPLVPSSEEAEAIAERWRPLRAVAARILWHEYLSVRRS